MDTQEGMSEIPVLYFEDLDSFLKHLPGKTTLVVVEMHSEAEYLPQFEHPANATYLFGPEIAGISEAELKKIRSFFQSLNGDIPVDHLQKNKNTAHLKHVQLDTKNSLNLGVCVSLVMYDRHTKPQF